MAELTPFERDIRQLAADLRRLETAYTQYFAGQLRRPPIDLRNRVDALIRQHDRAYIQGYADRYRFATLQARYHKFVELWDRSTRAREEGRGVGPAAARAGCAEPPTPTPPRTEPSEPAPCPSTSARRSAIRPRDRSAAAVARPAGRGQRAGRATGADLLGILSPRSGAGAQAAAGRGGLGRLPGGGQRRQGCLLRKRREGEADGVLTVSGVRHYHR